jgi:CPA2 family monovalent cation:H+ antiporter-2
MAGTESSHPPIPSDPHVIIAGFGIPGRFIAELLDFHELPYSVIEQNPSIVERCTKVPMVFGDARSEDVLKQAGIEKATMMAITIPLESVVHEIIAVAKRMKPDVKIAARVNYTSAGLKAQQLGAEHVVIGEQLIAREFFRIFEKDISKTVEPEKATGK